jgi:hypothetical protein
VAGSAEAMTTAAIRRDEDDGGARSDASHAGNENSVEEALQDRRETLVPNWINEDQPFRRHKPIGVGGDVRAIELQVMAHSALDRSVLRRGRSRQPHAPSTAKS